MARHKTYSPHGVIPAVLLPFDNDLAIDEQNFRKHLRDVAAIVLVQVRDDLARHTQGGGDDLAGLDRLGFVAGEDALGRVGTQALRQRCGLGFSSFGELPVVR